MIGFEDVYYESKLGNMRIEQGLSHLKNANYKIYVLTIIETLGIVMVTCWQIWYIKKLLGDQHIV